MTLLTGGKVNLATTPINWTYAPAYNQVGMCNFSRGPSALYPMRTRCLQKASAQGVKTCPMHTGMFPWSRSTPTLPSSPTTTISRRMGFCLASMYFDDLTVQDLGSLKGSAQQFITSLATELGSPFQPEKHQITQSQSDFLGLVHDVSNCHQGQPVRFWLRDRLITKVTDLMDEATQTNRLPPGLAAKLFGCLGFLNTGCFGKLGRSGLSPLKERQYSRDTALTEDLSRSFVTIKSLLTLRPERGSRQRYVAASDAAQDEPRQGSAGLLFVGPQGERDAYVVDITAELFTLWSEHPTKIAQLELLTVYVGFIFVASQARSCQGLWFVDNIAALMALVKGRSDNPEPDTMAGCIHALLY